MLVMLRRDWGGPFRRSETNKSNQPIPGGRRLEFHPGVPLEVEPQDLPLIEKCLGKNLQVVELDDKGRPRIVDPSQPDETGSAGQSAAAVDHAPNKPNRTPENKPAAAAQTSKKSARSGGKKAAAGKQSKKAAGKSGAAKKSAGTTKKPTRKGAKKSTKKRSR